MKEQFSIQNQMHANQDELRYNKVQIKRDLKIKVCKGRSSNLGRAQNTQQCLGDMG